MPKWLKYYQYKLRESFSTVMLGTEKSQIIETVEHYRNRGYDIYVPKQEEIYDQFRDQKDLNNICLKAHNL